ncbi:hypothetical protein [Azospirillum brasilense]|uniref:hypothetical protein n=1 Tax=Azospirillum brasilense TaxID=192 RepID=UPI001FECFAAA|nr:hypothetical protein [Azospirillum brasilense]
MVDAAPAQLPSPDSVARALEVLKGAKRPLIILGKGAAYAQADEAVRELVEKSGIPFLPMSMAKGLLPDTHPQSAGAARSMVLKDADVVVLVGARLNWLLSHGKGKTWGEPGSKTFIQIDLVKVVDAAPAQLPSPDSVARALEVLKGAKRPLIILGKGAAYAQADEAVRELVEKSGIPFLPMSMAKGLLPDTHPQSAGAARSMVLKDADVVVLVGARLNWLLSHGKGKTWGEPGSKTFIQIDCRTARARPGASRGRRPSSRSTSSRARWTATWRSWRRWSATSGPASRR